ncbi:MAG: 1-(5-phosphoribosyl)-5-[(5-phosphoribosylamino) methylideneamino] imidazole-4-carboxamide isomerase [Melioribacteraceae bacterium]|nr:MAG: 1-(5-phosphoribosyl)-5-[(5-phosphoribosylamino) methylideneamino] imidazole-4-carboxamide isomerase [Melioribacteraceae bacterium]
MKNLLIIPSIDIKDGRTVRVVQGIPELGCKKYESDPVEMAMIWRAENAKCIHVVDFDAAIAHSKQNFELIGEICDSVVIPVELGGGIMDMETAERLIDLGIFRIVIGTLTTTDMPEFIKILEKFGPTKVVAAIDVVDDEIVNYGRTQNSGIRPLDHAQKLADAGVQRIIVTDVSRNGMLAGPNLKLSHKIATETGVKVTHSGGIRGFNDLLSLKNFANLSIDSVIIGRALYENKFPCQKIWRVAESGIFT